MTPRERLHRLVEELPEGDLPTAERVLEALADAAAPYTPLENAPLDDEPETEEERQAVREALAEAERGEGFSTEELRKRLGLG